MKVEWGSVAAWVAMIFRALVFVWQKIHKWHNQSRKAKQCDPAESAATFRAPDAEEVRTPKTFEEAPKATHPEPVMMQMMTSATVRPPDAARSAPTVAHNPYAADLKVECKIMEEIGVLQFTIENCGPKDVVIDYMKMHVLHNGQERSKFIKSNDIELEENLLDLFDGFGFLEHIPPSQHPVGSNKLESGDICHRFVSLYFNEDARRELKEFIRNKTEAETVWFEVCTDKRNFPFKPNESVISAIVSEEAPKEQSCT